MEKYHHGDVDKDELKRMKEKYRRGELSQDEMLDVLVRQSAVWSKKTMAISKKNCFKVGLYSNVT